MTQDVSLRRALQAKGARGVAVLDLARRRVVEQAGEPTPLLHLPARREALCQSIESQIEAASLLRADALGECLLVLDGVYFIAHSLAAQPRPDVVPVARRRAGQPRHRPSRVVADAASVTPGD
ncbi:MAG: hypothetical protein R3B70_09165 [Polyangiaceae bacterium]